MARSRISLLTTAALVIFVLTVILTFILLHHSNAGVEDFDRSKFNQLKRNRLFGPINGKGTGNVPQIITTDTFATGSAEKVISPSILPGFAIDKSEFVFNGILERSSSSPSQFYITTFLLSHYFLKDMDIETYLVKNDSKAEWLRAFWQFGDAKYYPSGRRHHHAYSCHVFLNNNLGEIILPAEFVPNRGTNLINNNRKLDIMRCPMIIRDKSLVEQSIKLNQSIQVVLYRKDTPLIRYDIPWRSRAVGLMIPQHASLVGYKPWQAPSDPSMHPSNTLRAHACISIMRKSISRVTAGLLLENIAHHLSIGFDHIMLSVPWDHTSPQTSYLAQMLRSYIQENKLTLLPIQSRTSTQGDAWRLFELHGLHFPRLVVALIQANICLYWSKGVADYMMIADLDEFLVPQGHYGNHTLQSILHRHLHPSQLWPNTSEQFVGQQMMEKFDQHLGGGDGPGWADGHPHPFCYLAINSQLLLPHPQHRFKSRDDMAYGNGRWVGMSFPFGVEMHPSPALQHYLSINISLLPVDRIVFAGYRGPGACHLPRQFTPCFRAQVDHVVGSDPERHCLSRNGLLSTSPPSATAAHLQSLDMRVMDEDARHIPTSELAVYHVRYFDRSLSPSEESQQRTNAYHSIWFPIVHADLKRRGLDLLIELPAEPLIEPSHSSAFVRLMNSRDRKEFLPQDASINLESVRDDDLNTTAASVPTHESIPPLFSSLPSFSTDFSEYVMTSLIERTSLSSALSVTTFLMHHTSILPRRMKDRQAMLQLHPSSFPWWQRAVNIMKSTKYDAIGRRISPHRIQCRIVTAVRFVVSNENESLVLHPQAEEYVINGSFVPTNLNEDPNANGRVDILRCPIPENDGLELLKLFVVYKDEYDWSIKVEICKDGNPISQFFIPWRSRITGFMSTDLRPLNEIVNSPDIRGLQYASVYMKGKVNAAAHEKKKSSVLNAIWESQVHALPASGLDPWTGLKLEDTSIASPRSLVYLGVPGWYSPIDKENLSHLLEFLDYHIALGVDHIFLPVSFPWDSPEMVRLFYYLEPYLRKRQITIACQTGDGVPYRFSLGGGIWHPDAIKNFYANVLGYYTKGMAEFLALWDVDEFFVPAPGKGNLRELLLEISPSAHYVAHGHDHPFCYIELSSSTYFRLDSAVKPYNGVQLPPLPHLSVGRRSQRTISSVDQDSTYNLWIGDNYQRFIIRNDFLSHKKAIHITEFIGEVGLHTSGLCKLPLKFTPCHDEITSNESISTNQVSSPYEVVDGGCYSNDINHEMQLSARRTHFYNEFVTRDDAKMFNSSTMGHIYHLQFFRNINIEILADPKFQKNLKLREAAGMNISQNLPSLIEIFNSSWDDNMQYYSTRFGINVWTRINQRGLFHPLVLLNDPTYDHAPNMILYSIEYNKHAQALQEKQKEVAQLKSTKNRHKASELLPSRLGETPIVLLSSVLVHYPYKDIFHYALLTFVTALPLAKGNVMDASISIDDLDIFCDLTYGQSTYGIRGVIHHISSGFSVIRCMLSDSIRESVDDDITVKMKFLVRSRYSQVSQQFNPAKQGINGPSSEHSLRSVYFTIPRTLIGTGLGFPVIDDTIDTKDFNNEGYLLSVEQTAYQRSYLFDRPVDFNIQHNKYTAENESLPDRLHLYVVNGYHDITTRKTVPFLLEFLQHHYNIGIDHIYLPLHYHSWRSVETNKLLKILKPFITRGQLTVWPIDHFQILDGYDEKVISLKRSLLEEYSQLLCNVHSHHLDGTHIAHWRVNQFLLPTKQLSQSKSVYSWLSLSTHVPLRITRQHVDPLPALEMYVTNPLRSIGQVQGLGDERSYLGDIYSDNDDYQQLPPVDPVVDADPRLDGMILKADGIVSLVSSTQPSDTSDNRKLFSTASNVELYDFHSLPHLHPFSLMPCALLPPLEIELQGLYGPNRDDQDIFEERWLRARYRSVCSYKNGQYNANNNGSLHTSERVVNGKRYVQEFFPRVYAELVAKGLDYFIDGIPMKARDEMGLLDYVKYDMVFTTVLNSSPQS